MEFSDEIKYGLVQHKNGPCGILSVIQAVMISQFIMSDSFDPIAYCATDLDLANAIYSIIKLVSNPLQHVKIANWINKSHLFDISIEEIE